MPGAPTPTAAHADDIGWINCVGGMAAQWGNWGYVAYEWTHGHDWELGGIAIWFSVYVVGTSISGYECVNYLLENDNDTCYIYTQTQQGNFIIGDTEPQYGGYATFECEWNY